MKMTKGEARAYLVSIFKSQVGVKESDTEYDKDHDANNDGTEIRKYQSATWLPVGAWAWCAALCCWCLKEAAKNPDFAFISAAI